MPASRILLCTDLDRTLIPNGPESESPHARELFSRFCARDDVFLAFVSGRDKGLVMEAIDEFQLPLPDFAITDVGSTIYEVDNSNWITHSGWYQIQTNTWRHYKRIDLENILQPISALQLQEESKQNTFKLSYYLDLNHDHKQIIQRMEDILQTKDIPCNIIWSIDIIKNIGLIDILPKTANKFNAIHFLAENLHIDRQHVIFSGDSGNDLDVISSDIRSILVANATDEVKQMALSRAQKNMHQDSVYVAEGGLLGMNGNYAAGILEGVCHYFPTTLDWIKTSAESLSSIES